MVVRGYRGTDLGAVTAYWNRSFGDQPNFRPVTPQEFQERVVTCPLFDPAGLLLAWTAGRDDEQIVGMVHAVRPTPPVVTHHFLVLLHVDPAHRRQGIGGRLLQAAESWLYYCPVYVGVQDPPCYGNRDGVLPPLFGPSGVPGLGMGDRASINFFAHRGYRSVGVGDVSMGRSLQGGDDRLAHPSLLPSRIPTTFRLVETGGTSTLLKNEGLALLEEDGRPVGEAAWAALGPGRWAITRWHVAEAWRGQGLGRFLLDDALARIWADAHGPLGVAGGGIAEVQVEIRVHLERHRLAVDLLKRRGFVVDAAWVSLVKT